MKENEIYNQFSVAYNVLFQESIQSFKEAVGSDRKYAVFYPSFGIKPDEHCNFLIYGQAVNGWSPDFNTHDRIDYKQLLQDSIEYSNSYYKKKNHSPLDWVNIYWSNSSYNEHVKTGEEIICYPKLEYRVFRSFFWNVVYKLVCRFYDIDTESFDWSKKIVWSNLYKIAPKEGGNPNDKECLLQDKYSFELVKKEIEELKPKYCIVITNETWWKPFQEYLNSEKINQKTSDVIQSIEMYKGTKIIVTSRPFSGNNSNHANEILDALKI